MNNLLRSAGLACLSLLTTGYGSAEWPNEPAGAQVISDFGFDARSGNGWNATYPSGGAIVADPAAPFSGPSVLQNYRPVNSQGNCARPILTFSPTNEIWIGYWVKVSDGYWGWGNFSMKLAVILTNGSWNMWTGTNQTAGQGKGPHTVKMYMTNSTVDNSHLGFKPYDGCTFLPNAGSGAFSLGQWHRVEAYVKRSTSQTSRDGVIRFWLDGTLAGNYTTVNFPDGQMNEIAITPSWDSADPTQPTPDYQWFDHFRVSKPNGNVVSPFMITTGALSSARSGVTYLTTLQATGGKAPYSWTITSGSLLPGLSLNKSTGAISGTPTSGGKCEFTVKAFDSNVPPLEATRSFNIVASGTSGVSNRADPIASGFRIENGARMIRFTAPSITGEVRLNVYDLNGKLVSKQIAQQADIVTGHLETGVYVAELVCGKSKSAVRFNVVR